MIKIAICDDDISFGNTIKNYINNISNILNISICIKVFLSGIELLEHIENNENFDVIFIDICMPDMNGANVGIKIKSKQDTIIVYMSVSNQYFIDIFEVKPFGFFRKPIEYTEFERIFFVIYNHIFNLNTYFEFKSGRDNTRIKYKDIIYFKSLGRQISLCSVNGEFKFYDRLKNIYNMVSKYKFLYIHKSYVINYNHILRITYNYVEMSNGEVLNISERRKKDIRRLYVWMSEKNDFKF